MPVRRLPPLRALEAFVRVVRLGSAKAAANELALSPSALSRRVAALEDFTGKRLFTRQHQAMKLTDEGQAFYTAIAPKLEELAEAVEAQIDRGQVLRLHLGVPSLFGGQRLFPRLPELRKLHPRLHIDIDTGAHLEDRVGDTLDAAIILAKEPDPQYYRVQLDHNKVYAITSQALAEELGPVPDEAKLSRQTFLIHQDLPDSLDAWKRAIDLPDLDPASVDRFDSGQLVLEAAAQGLGIAIMHDDHFRRSHDTRLARVYDIEVESPYRYWFVCRPKSLEARPVRIFHEWLLQAGL
ncbi:MULTISPECIES: LysR substrate-binding domain-containing protein [Sphingomonadaceae]|uniref:LysR substrate-binding domain-containing protein n=2 Tax=Sphingomonadales TaxID=204457 RepID=UPI0002E0416C|nr:MULTISPECIES: LysR substrate-binding domain-containing protein [Sphingomonadaceae]MBF7010300.1 LysR family transcriptional regulator [Novosphingobium sp. HR1a]MEE4451899.1 LysR substrate-binding domain-containing protein [Novosphingobium resinovorum]WJM28308.1 LysR substrate-binding domain-containing protein [Novosphingobium resinovorum]